MEENKAEMTDLERLRHSAAHVLAQAVKELFPETKLGIGPVIEDGFYYDFGRKEPFKKELLDELSKKSIKPTFYRQGTFTDLCRGPHVNYTSKVKAFKLLKVSGAYWKGDQSK